MKTMKRKQTKRITCTFGMLIGCILILWPAVLYSQVWKRIENRPQTLGLEQGLLEFETPEFELKIVKASHTVAALMPVGQGGFDYTPSDRLEIRSRNGLYHLGDLTLRLRT
ncbi:MAG TPA: hypothetical protein ENF21_09675, partial [Bacteroidetes bacterium]|nr:hypothetical protein [Bacteroidota bacterium]